MQEGDRAALDPGQLRTVTERAPSAAELEALLFAWRVVMHVKSNAIVFARAGQTVGIGAGQMSRVDSVKFGAQKAVLPLPGTVLASDAFFPFPDGVEEAARATSRKMAVAAAAVDGIGGSGWGILAGGTLRTAVKSTARSRAGSLDRRAHTRGTSVVQGPWLGRPDRGCKAGDASGRERSDWASPQEPCRGRRKSQKNPKMTLYARCACARGRLGYRTWRSRHKPAPFFT